MPTKALYGDFSTDTL